MIEYLGLALFWIGIGVVVYAFVTTFPLLSIGIGCAIIGMALVGRY